MSRFSMLALVRPTLNKAMANNSQHMAVLGAKFLECWNFCRISVGHGPVGLVLGARSRSHRAVVGFLTAPSCGLGMCVEAGDALMLL